MLNLEPLKNLRLEPPSEYMSLSTVVSYYNKNNSPCIPVNNNEW
jgi:hypothetical protein